MTNAFDAGDVLVEICKIQHGVEIDLVYASENNLTGKPIYLDLPCMLLSPAEKALRLAAEKANQLGFRLKIFDAFRPLEAQRVLWDFLPDPRYVADPAYGSQHNRGVAVDLTLIDSAGNELDMGTHFDTMSEESHHGFRALPQSVQRNRAMLLGVMLISGFTYMPTEWWHYELPHAERFKIIDDIKHVEYIAQ